ncbi:MAG: hypothetical protein AAF805_11195, partial [Planctomycetota bacterium]
MRPTLMIGLMALSAAPVGAADFEFYGRSGDAISLDFGSLPGVASGASFTAPTLGFGSAHALLS